LVQNKRGTSRLLVNNLVWSTHCGGGGGAGGKGWSGGHGSGSASRRAGAVVSALEKRCCTCRALPRTGITSRAFVSSKCGRWNRNVAVDARLVGSNVHDIHTEGSDLRHGWRWHRNICCRLTSSSSRSGRHLFPRVPNAKVFHVHHHPYSVRARVPPHHACRARCQTHTGAKEQLREPVWIHGTDGRAQRGR